MKNENWIWVVLVGSALGVVYGLIRVANVERDVEKIKNKVSSDEGGGDNASGEEG